MLVHMCLYQCIGIISVLQRKYINKSILRKNTNLNKLSYDLQVFANSVCMCLHVTARHTCVRSHVRLCARAHKSNTNHNPTATRRCIFDFRVKILCSEYKNRRAYFHLILDVISPLDPSLEERWFFKVIPWILYSLVFFSWLRA